MLTSVILSGLIISAAMAQKPAYSLFREDGKRVKYEKMVEAAAEADIVLFGEYHTNPISHWLQLELSTDLYELKGKALVLGAEMFEADNQLIMNEYLAGQITEAKFEEEARLWKNYQTDYKPLVLLAKESRLDFIATNIPRRYANMVFKKGASSLDSLSEQALGYIAPLPLEYDTSLNCYKQLMGSSGPPMTKTPVAKTPMHKAPAADTLKKHDASKMPIVPKSPMAGHGNKNLADAQAIKDATMSFFILKHWKPGMLFIHYNGAYHSDDFESMNWFLNRANPDLKIVTISTVSQDDIKKLDEDSEGKANFIIAVPSTMTQTHR